MMLKAFCSSILLFPSLLCSAETYLITLFWDDYSPLVVIKTPEGVYLEKAIQEKDRSIIFNHPVEIEIYSENDHVTSEYSATPDKRTYILNKILIVMTEDKLTPSNFLYKGTTPYKHPASLQMKVRFYFASGNSIDLSNQTSSAVCTAVSEDSNTESCTPTCIAIPPNSRLIQSVHDLLAYNSFTSGLNFDYSLFNGMSLVASAKKHYVFEHDGQKKKFIHASSQIAIIYFQILIAGGNTEQNIFFRLIFLNIRVK